MINSFLIFYTLKKNLPRNAYLRSPGEDFELRGSTLLPMDIPEKQDHDQDHWKQENLYQLQDEMMKMEQQVMATETQILKK